MSDTPADYMRSRAESYAGVRSVAAERDALEEEVRRLTGIVEILNREWKVQLDEAVGLLRQLREEPSWSTETELSLYQERLALTEAKVDALLARLDGEA